MSRFDFYEDEKSRRCARAACDRVVAELEKYKRNRDFGQLDLTIILKQGEPFSFDVVPRVSVRADSLLSVEER
jgi:hypothetical protein